MSVDTSGSAFPVSNGVDTDWGMTLRDYFAAKVIAALISGPDEALEFKGGETIDEAIARHWLGEAKMAYLISDAMLKAREATS
ncbi:hypothetical protein [uncultured Sulfitobacter sp.]|uniref:hypothetical protein n=1 Tax=uncultured Sulfitobacter sp. TaxID=191468 RepID=UPI0030DDBA07